MARSQITVNTSPVADHYGQHPTERVIEFSSPNGGGLIAFRMREDGTLSIEPYRLDDTVDVNLPPDAYRFYTIRSSDVGRSSLQAFGRNWSTDFMGRVQDGDVGKRVYCVAESGSTHGHLQVENDDQVNRRLSTGEEF